MTAAALGDYRNDPESETHALLLRQMLSYGDEDITVTDSAPAFDVLVRCVNDGVRLGACLMYGVLKSGAR